MPRFENKSLRTKEGLRLKKLRSRLKMTQRELAEEFKVSDGAIDHWEHGNRTIPGPVLKLIEIYEKKSRS